MTIQKPNFIQICGGQYFFVLNCHGMTLAMHTTVHTPGLLLDRNGYDLQITWCHVYTCTSCCSMLDLGSCCGSNCHTTSSYKIMDPLQIATSFHFNKAICTYPQGRSNLQCHCRNSPVSASRVLCKPLTLGNSLLSRLCAAYMWRSDSF